ncbi:MAG: glycine--tRNA ligase [Chthoniobacter sp.]
MSQPKEIPQMEKIVSLAKRRGFIFQSSEIYGGINGFWDYGPLGAELKRNLRDTWWRAMTRDREDVVGLDATIIMHPAIWKASGHVDTFSDPMSDCLVTKKRFRSDHVELQSGVVYRWTGAKDETGKTSEDSFAALLAVGKPAESARKVAAQFYTLRGLTNPELLGETTEKIENTRSFNPENGAQLTEPKPFNLMFSTYVGATATEADKAYLRPETAQAIFAQFKNVVDSSRQKVPFGICQIGKAFRNEVTPRNFTFRSREFEQMELEFFIKPDEAIEAVCGHVATWNEGVDPLRAKRQLGLGNVAPLLGPAADRLLCQHRPRRGRARLPLADEGRTGALRPRLRGHPLQVPLRHRRTRRHRRAR